MVLKNIVILLAAIMVGCANQQFWHDQTIDPGWCGKFKSVEFVFTSNMRYWCSDSPGAVACASRNYINGTCVIYTSTSNGYVIWHELRHCAGKDHPGFGHTYFTEVPDSSNEERDK